MPFKLTKEELATRAALVQDLTEAANRLDVAVSEYNKMVDEHRPDVEKILSDYNNILSRAEEFCSGIAGTAETDMGDKSEKWMESEKGEAAQEYVNAWEGITLDEITIDWPDELVVGELGHATELDELPQEADL